MSERTTRRVAVITGGSSGIGLCTAMLFARRGYRVGLIARGEAGLAAAKARIDGAGGLSAIGVADVTDAAALERAAAKMEAELGPIDVWINNAGAGFFGTFADTTEAEFRRVVDVVFFGMVNGTRVALARMRPRRRGVIVNVGSLAGYRGAPLQTPYSSAKFAMRGFTEAIRAELIYERARVHVGIVHPPSVNTPFFSHAASRMSGGEPRPLPPVYQPEVIAEALWIAVAERRREMKVSLPTIQFAFANWLLPGMSDRVSAFFGNYTQRTRSAEVARRREPTLFAPSRKPSSIHGPFGSEAFRSTWTNLPSARPVAYGMGAVLLALLMAPRRR